MGQLMHPIPGQPPSRNEAVQAAVDSALAKAGRSAVPFGLPNNAQRAALREQSAEEHAAVNLQVVTPPRLAEVVQKEVERRTALFIASNERSPRRAVAYPRRAALESVFDDLVKGRLS